MTSRSETMRPYTSETVSRNAYGIPKAMATGSSGGSSARRNRISIDCIRPMTWRQSPAKSTEVTTTIERSSVPSSSTRIARWIRSIRLPPRPAVPAPPRHEGRAPGPALAHLP